MLHERNNFVNRTFKYLFEKKLGRPHTKGEASEPAETQYARRYFANGTPVGIVLHFFCDLFTFWHCFFAALCIII